MRRYIWLRRDAGWSAPTTLLKVMTVAAIKIVLGAGPFLLLQNGEALGAPRSRSDTLLKLRQVLRYRDIGNTYRVRNGKGDVVFTTRAVRYEDYTKPDSTSGNVKADTLWNWTTSKHAAFKPRYAGAYVCKSTSGGSSPSQHSFGNAIDVFYDTFDHQERVAAAVVEQADLLHPYHVISGSRIWTKGQGWHSYTGTYHSHLHVDFDPQQSGACGVKG